MLDAIDPERRPPAGPVLRDRKRNELVLLTTLEANRQNWDRPLGI
ncbi:hypothetical protein [Streptomyces sp. NPDC056549]